METFLHPKNNVEVVYILVQRGGNDPYHVPGQKWVRLMKEYLLSDRCADLAILMTGGMKPEYYNRERISYFFLVFDQVLKG